MIGRRTVVIGAIAVAGLPVLAQPQAPRLALVEQGERRENMVEGRHPYWTAFLVELRQLGHAEGQTIVIDRWTTTDVSDEAFARLAAAVVETRPDVVLARGGRLITAFAAATSEIPVVGMGTFPIVLALSRPGGNLTGFMTSVGGDLYMKQLELLLRSVPTAVRIGYFGPRDSWEGPVGQATRQGADRLGLSLIPVIVENPATEDAIRTAFLGVPDQNFDALFVSAVVGLTVHARLIAELTRAAHLPAISMYSEYAYAGLMMAYGPDWPEVFRHAARYVDRILDGADPGEMPIEQPTEFEFVLNLRTAAALGVTFPAEILAFATEVIE